MKKRGILLVAAFCLIGAVRALSVEVVPELSQEAAKAKAMVERAVRYIEENGRTIADREKVFKEFSNLQGPFVQGDYYLFVYDFNGVVLAHGADSTLIGKNLIDKTDPNHVPLIKDMVEGARTAGEGWLSFEWPHPETKKVQPKTAFYKRPKGMDLFIGCGYYPGNMK